MRAAIANAGTPSFDGDQIHYVGPDDDGVELEVIVVMDDADHANFSVIHAMPTAYRRTS